MKIYIMSGLIGSGKSYKAKQIREAHTGMVILNKDAIRTMIFGEYKFESSYEPIVKDFLDAMMKECFLNGVDFIIDETNLTKKKRKNILHHINMLQIMVGDREIPEIVLVYCTEKKKNLRNRMKSPKGIEQGAWKIILDSMKKSFEKPTKAECEKLNIELIKHKIV